MKKLVAIAFLLLPVYSFSQISVKYPHDVNIENDPDVLFVEKFDDGLTNIFSRYHNRVNTEGMALEKDLQEHLICNFNFIVSRGSVIINLCIPNPNPLINEKQIV